MRVCLQRAPLYCTQQSQCKQTWRHQRLSDPPASHKTRIIVADNNEAATKSTYLWNKWTISPVPQMAMICGRITIHGHNIARIVAATMQVKKNGEAPVCLWHRSAAGHWNMKKLCPGKAKYFRWSVCRNQTSSKNRRMDTFWGKSVTKLGIEKAKRTRFEKKCDRMCYGKENKVIANPRITVIWDQLCRMTSGLNLIDFPADRNSLQYEAIVSANHRKWRGLRSGGRKA